MFFSLSKILWFIVDPAHILAGLFFIGTALTFVASAKWQGIGRRFLVGGVAVTVLLAILPFGRWMIAPLENRFPIPSEFPSAPAGIVIAGGVLNQFVTDARGQMALNDAIERLTVGAELAKRFPNAKIIYSAGSGDPARQDLKEADYVVPFFTQLGLPAERILLESQSRNTAENATYSLEIGKPQPGEAWVLVTSAFHMPRAMGSFRAAGWDIVAYPTDYHYPPVVDTGLRFGLRAGLSQFSAGLHEWLGLTFYWLTGRSDALFPAP